MENILDPHRLYVALMAIPVLRGNPRMAMVWARYYFRRPSPEWEELLRRKSEECGKRNNQCRDKLLGVLFDFVRSPPRAWPEAEDWVTARGLPQDLPDPSLCMSLVREAKELAEDLYNRPEVREVAGEAHENP